ncbi:UDP-N-acetylmuramate dehydrogenase [Paramicrobacterium agarici]|uniref:UDP-N-acetylenolpyruvoylglucosamine reductase n=1 Tax=Paramicrobacterium agarici TaxID=630514 RepID=A0A2A9DT91_9MICO|nr:UDP-N-acetylmuramate dehydrogenase [Microbacterium agarici]PFG29192.1 UDP-N-acetylmuramate dehydrogenase [Microbacterium agarici]
MSELAEPTPLAELTTLGIGGAPERMLVAEDTDELVAQLTDLWQSDEPWMVLGGGSNTVATDDEIAGAVVLIRTQGIERIATDEGVVLRVQAGETWDDLVAYAVENRLAGIEALSGIPGSVGAAPIQNIGAYGQELSSVLLGVELLDVETGERSHVPASALGLGYRTSVLKRHGGADAERDAVVLSVDLLLTEAPDGMGRPVAYTQLASALEVELGDRVELTRVRDAVLRLRRSKGMVLDPSDRDTYSAGSFFTNPIVTEQASRVLPADAPRWPQGNIDETVTVIPLDGSSDVVAPPPIQATLQREVKLSAAWLIEHASIPRGFHLPGSRAAISSKHTLALTNQGNARADDIAALARFVQARVQSEFGITLQPEPVLIDIEL